ncbi:MAG: magnesium/cobalt transporter CorA [Bacteroidales bacterium]|nr:magnesium/cobalt transporter CorA [Bacteroidales bacterium]
MARFLKSRIKAKGAAPGSLIFIGKKQMERPNITLLKYNSENVSGKECGDLDEAVYFMDEQHVNWLNIDGIHDTNLIHDIGKQFNISPIALENVLNTGQRPKFFEEDNAITLIVKAISFDKSENQILVDHISFILLENTIISLQERTSDHFDHVRQRIIQNIGRIRKASADYLLYTLVDSLVDNYLINLEQIGDKVESLENKLSHPSKELSSLLFQYKTEISYFKKTVRPLREVLTRMLRSKSYLIQEDHLPYYHELYDLVEQSIEAVDNYFTITNDLINLYNTNISNRANDVMKVLTIFASIFIPLTFIAGIYGTNFEYLPELQYKYAYFIMWGVMAVIAGVMLMFFKKQKWF